VAPVIYGPNGELKTDLSQLNGSVAE